MKYRILGKTGLKVSEVGFGAWAIGGNKFGNSYGSTNDDESLKALFYAFENGCNFFDTADIYGYGHSEKLIGDLVSKVKRDEIILSTKVGGDFSSGYIKRNFNPDYIKSAVEDSMKRLNTDYIDIYQLYNPPIEVIRNGQVFQVMNELKKSGKIRFFGVSVYNQEEGFETMKNEVDTIQLVYNLFEPEDGDALFETADKLKIGVIAREPLCNGLLTGKYPESHYFPNGDIRHGWPVSYITQKIRSLKSLRPLLNDEIDTLTKLSLKFVLNNSSVDVMIPGCKTQEQAKENLSVSDLRVLTDEEIKKISNLYKKHFNV